MTKLDASDAISRRRWTIGLSIAFVVAMVMGPGPGVLLVNSPDPVPLVHLPPIYAWGLFWYAVQATVVVLAYWKLWRTDEA